MSTKVAIDIAILDEAIEAGGRQTPAEAVHEALRKYIQRRKQIEILKLSGKVDFDPAYDYKQQR